MQTFHYIDDIYTQLVPAISNLVAIALSVACYILGAIGAYELAKRFGMKRPWLSWIPIANYYIYGALSDEITVSQRAGRKTKYRILLPVLGGSAVGGYILAVILTLIAIFSSFLSIGTVIQGFSEKKMVSMIGMFFSAFIFILILFFLVLLVSAALSVFTSIALYPVYRMFCSQGAALALAICGGIFGLHGIFLFAIRNREPYGPQNGYGAPANAAVPPQNPYSNGQPNPYAWQNPYDNSSRPPQNG